MRSHIEPPSDASKAEVNIHNFLDDLGVHKINVSEFILSESRLESKRI